MTNPFVKWVGGKRTLLTELMKYTPKKINTYYEPMVGGGALFFHLASLHQFKEAKLSDLNEDLIGTYRVIRDDLKNILEALDTIQNAHNKAKSAEEFYYETRAQNNTELRIAEKFYFEEKNKIIRAARCIYLNKAGFNGLYRVNRRGKFNVPFGHKDKVNLYNKANMVKVHKVLQGVKLTIQDFEAAMELNTMTKHDCVYFDPPYWPKDQTSFVAYTSSGFDGADHQRMCDLLGRLKSRGIMAMVSNASMPPVRVLYKEFPISDVKAPRKINSDATKRGNVKEVIIRSKK